MLAKHANSQYYFLLGAKQNSKTQLHQAFPATCSWRHAQGKVRQVTTR
jgi:hypothetical protein